MNFKDFVTNRFDWLSYEEIKFKLADLDELIAALCDFFDPDPEPDCPENDINRDWNSEFKSKKGFHVFWGWTGKGEFLRSSYADRDCNLATCFVVELNHRGWNLLTESTKDSMWSCKAWRDDSGEFLTINRYSRLDSIVQVIKLILEA